MVGKETVSKDISGCLDSKASKGAVEEVRVGVDRVMEAKTSEWVHHGEIISIGALRHVPEGLELAHVQGVGVATKVDDQYRACINGFLDLRDVQVRAGRGYIRLESVV